MSSFKKLYRKQPVEFIITEHIVLKTQTLKFHLAAALTCVIFEDSMKARGGKLSYVSQTSSSEMRYHSLQKFSPVGDSGSGRRPLPPDHLTFW